MPSGEQLVDTAGDRASRLDRWLATNAEKADDLSDAATESTKAVGDAQKAISNLVKGRVGSGPPGATTAGTTTPRVQAEPQQQPTAAEAVSAVAVS